MKELLMEMLTNQINKPSYELAFEKQILINLKGTKVNSSHLSSLQKNIKFVKSLMECMNFKNVKYMVELNEYGCFCDRQTFFYNCDYKKMSDYDKLYVFCFEFFNAHSIDSCSKTRHSKISMQNVFLCILCLNLIPGQLSRPFTQKERGNLIDRYCEDNMINKDELKIINLTKERQKKIVDIDIYKGKYLFPLSSGFCFRKI